MTKYTRNYLNAPTIFVDESGSPGAKTHSFEHHLFVFGFCYCKKPRILERNLKTLLVQLHKKELYHPELDEIKFHPTLPLQKLGCTKENIKSCWEPHYDTIRKKVIDIIIKNSDGVFAGIVEKRELYNTGFTSEYIGNTLFQKSLIDHVIHNIDYSNELFVIYASGRLNNKRTIAFDKNMCNIKFKNKQTNTSNHFTSKTFHDVDSAKTPGIWAGDLVAGAFNMAYGHNESKYKDSLESKFINAGFARTKIK